MTDPPTKAERLAKAKAERTEAYRRYAEAWDAVAAANEGVYEHELDEARAALAEAERAQTEAEQKVRQIEAEP